MVMRQTESSLVSSVSGLIREFASSIRGYIRCVRQGHEWIRGEQENPPPGHPQVMHKCDSCGRFWIGKFEEGFKDGDDPPDM